MQIDVPIRAILAYSDFLMPTGASVRISVTASLGYCVLRLLASILLDLSKPTVLDCMRQGVTVVLASWGWGLQAKGVLLDCRPVSPHERVMCSGEYREREGLPGR